MKRDPDLTFEKPFPLCRRRRQLAADLLQRELVGLTLVQVCDARLVDLREKFRDLSFLGPVPNVRKLFVLIAESQKLRQKFRNKKLHKEGNWKEKAYF